MFPQSEIDKTECLETLVGIRTGCTVEERKPFWIEDIEGVDVNVLAAMAKGTNGSGRDFGQQLINSAAREFLGDIELLINNGYGLKEVAADMCSSNTLLTTYTPNAGIIVKSNIFSRFQQLKITKLQVLTNVTGERQLRFDDGFATTDYKVDLVAGQIMPMDFNYTTDRDQVIIKFTDPGVGVAKVSINKGSGCGCSGGGKVLGDVLFEGIVGSTVSSNQYGFLPCAAITCSYDQLICNMVKLTPNIFGLALFYKVAEKFFLHKAQSKRNNDVVSYNEGEQSELVRNYGALYVAKLYGKADRKAVKHVISDYLKKNHRDCCVICNSRSMVAAITG
jgi:hypothetical protein